MNLVQRSFFAAFLGAAALVSVAGCSDSGGGPTPTGATCPSDSMLTYDNFARAFFDDYCVNCHSSELASGQRHGAPLDHNFDTLELIRATHSDHIDEQAAAGPDAVNEFMPPSGPTPTEEERKKLGEWLACGMP